jgi:hypothetical protein
MKNAKNTKKGMLFLERRKVILVNKENYSHKHSPSAYKRWPKPYKIALLASRTLSLPRALSQPEEQLLLTITPQLVIPPLRALRLSSSRLIKQILTHTGRTLPLSSPRLIKRILIHTGCRILRSGGPNQYKSLCPSCCSS